jgi:hypothetical protein
MTETHRNEWYSKLSNEGKYVADLILKYHEYFSRKDKKYKYVVQIVKIIVLLLAMASTIVLGLTNTIEENLQINLGLVLSASITFFTAFSAFLNIERYWMRNITIHIELNKLRDMFIYEASENILKKDRLDYFMNTLDTLQSNNIKYWSKAIKNL